ncbi:MULTISPECIES: DNA-3-methyladenine glycosylase family protein [unclassified Knoellia]|uniref:DNA-3-methyladenine glycosylase family protein n=1 Tax=Knoellia altitudinis TaxID=3404795 RepID=UPI003620EA78
MTSPSDDWARHVREVADGHPVLAAELADHGLPERWSRPPGFPSLVLLILEQQVSLASAAACFARVRTRAGAMTPVALLATTTEELREDGVSRQKDRYLRALATEVTSGDLDVDGLASLADADVVTRLTALPGIGRWTSEAYLLACLDRPDVWPVGDRALQVAVAERLGLPQVPDGRELERLGEVWRPHRSTAARLLWHGYLARRGRRETVVDLTP